MDITFSSDLFTCYVSFTKIHSHTLDISVVVHSTLFHDMHVKKLCGSSTTWHVKITAITVMIVMHVAVRIIPTDIPTILNEYPRDLKLRK